MLPSQMIVTCYQSHVSHDLVSLGLKKKTKLGGMNLCALKSNFPVHLHKSFVDYQVFGSEVK